MDCLYLSRLCTTVRNVQSQLQAPPQSRLKSVIRQKVNKTYRTTPQNDLIAETTPIERKAGDMTKYCEVKQKVKNKTPQRTYQYHMNALARAATYWQKEVYSAVLRQHSSTRGPLKPLATKQILEGYYEVSCSFQLAGAMRSHSYWLARYGSTSYQIYQSGESRLERTWLTAKLQEVEVSVMLWAGWWYSTTGYIIGHRFYSCTLGHVIPASSVTLTHTHT